MSQLFNSYDGLILYFGKNLYGQNFHQQIYFWEKIEDICLETIPNVYFSRVKMAVVYNIRMKQLNLKNITNSQIFVLMEICIRI